MCPDGDTPCSPARGDEPPFQLVHGGLVAPVLYHCSCPACSKEDIAAFFGVTSSVPVKIWVATEIYFIIEKGAQGTFLSARNPSVLGHL